MQDTTLLTSSLSLVPLQYPNSWKAEILFLLFAIGSLQFIPVPKTELFSRGLRIIQQVEHLPDGWLSYLATQTISPAPPELILGAEMKVIPEHCWVCPQKRKISLYTGSIFIKDIK